MQISVICVYNDIEAYTSQLLVSLKLQDVEYELIGIDNRERKYPSAAAALNAGAEQAAGDVLVFAHQDITLKSSDGLRKFAEAIAALPVGSVVGTQGVRDRSKVYYENLTAGETYIADYRYDYPMEPIEVSCVDEGFFGMCKETWERHHFDEVLCDNWHLYAVESCLYNRKTGGHVYVYPIQIHHYSMGTISLGYMQNLKLLCKVYRSDFKYIWTTCYKVSTHPLYINLLVWAWTMNRRLRGRLR